MSTKEIHYTVYKGDDLVAHGAKEEVAERLGITESSLEWLTTPTAMHRFNRSSGNRMIAVKTILDEDDD